MRIISWNVNSLRARILNHTCSKKLCNVITSTSPLGKLIKKVNPDVICFQETKCIDGKCVDSKYTTYWNCAKKAGLDMQKVVDAVSGGAAGSWVLSNRAGNMINNTYPLGFRTWLHHKDLRIALETARELGVTIPVAALVDQIVTGLIARGYGDEDVSAVARSIREASGID